MNFCDPVHFSRNKLYFGNFPFPTCCPKSFLLSSALSITESYLLFVLSKRTSVEVYEKGSDTKKVKTTLQYIEGFTDKIQQLFKNLLF